MNLPLKTKIKIHFKASPQYLLVFSSLFLTAWISGKYVEAVCFAVTFCLLRYKFVNILHCNTTFKCMLLTNGIIFVFIPITVPLSNSLFGGLLTGFVVNYLANLVASNAFRAQETQELKRLRKEKFACDIYALSEPDLRKYCRSCNFDCIDEEITVQRLIYHLKGQELYQKIGYSKPQMLRREKRIEEKLNIKLKDR